MITTNNTLATVYPGINSYENPVPNFVDPMTMNPSANYLTTDGALLSQYKGTIDPYAINNGLSNIGNDNGFTNYKLLNKSLDMQQANQEPMFVKDYLKPAGYVINGLSSLGSLWLGFKNYGLAKKQLGIAQDQWNQTKQELSRINTIRKNLTNSYVNGE